MKMQLLVSEPVYIDTMQEMMDFNKYLHINRKSVLITKTGGIDYPNTTGTIGGLSCCGCLNENKTEDE